VRMLRMGRGNQTTMCDHGPQPWRRYVALAILARAIATCPAAAAPRPACTRVVIQSDVSAGHQWSASLAEGWVFRILPITPSKPEYSGWDLVVDRQQPAGFPDALLLATMPYNSINEREIGTTFRLRAQDAIGWNPRSFHFFTDPADFREGQQLFRTLIDDRTTQAKTNDPRSPAAQAMARLLALQKHASSGEFRILDARIVPGIGDPEPYAQGWARASSQTPHENDPAPLGKPTVQGTLNWMRFALTLWLPGHWRVPIALHPVAAACPN
jgi:hypothetical protein